MTTSKEQHEKDLWTVIEAVCDHKRDYVHCSKQWIKIDRPAGLRGPQQRMKLCGKEKCPVLKAANRLFTILRN